MEKLLKSESTRKFLFFIYIGITSSLKNMEEIITSENPFLKKILFTPIFLILGIIKNICITGALCLFGSIVISVLYYNQDTSEKSNFYFNNFTKIMILVSIIEVMLNQINLHFGNLLYD
ncbi:hypothetical protein [Flavobacterium sp.]|uniref:hypothetical protein n=1 Tax=Flavobacterium sp. TaxID=239 RepID=UPI0039E3A1CF